MRLVAVLLLVAFMAFVSGCNSSVSADEMGQPSTSESQSGRYQLVAGSVRIEPRTDPVIVGVTSQEYLFKIDTTTGEVWVLNDVKIQDRFVLRFVPLLK